jgi:ATP-binding cassette subfamily F protein 3
MHLLSMVADRLWLVKNGRVSNYDEDLEAYRNMLLAGDKPAEKPVEKVRAPSPPATPSSSLRAEVRKCEDRLQKIDEMRDKLAKKLADPELYEDSRRGELETWNKKYAEVMDALHRAEALWEQAQAKLEQAEAA